MFLLTYEKKGLIKDYKIVLFFVIKMFTKKIIKKDNIIE